MITREIEQNLLRMASQFPVVALMGPRQSGKTTVCKSTFKNHAYVSLEDLDSRLAAATDPRNFLASFDHRAGVIIDEIQESPELLSYMQGIVDQKYRPGFFIITGSQNFLLHEKITQSLAGRIALLTLLPLNTSELKTGNLLADSLDEVLLKGFYPRPHVQNIRYQDWFSNYISTYVEKDVRQVLKINDLVTFQRFIKLCAARIGSILNYADIARDCDISLNTAKAWISVLESSYIIKLLYPYYKNFNKRVMKSPKLYFYDTGIACALLGIQNQDSLNIHPMRGHLFESLILSEIFKYSFNHTITSSIYFWRDVQGHEIDVLIEKSFDQVIPIEIKSRMTFSQDFFKRLKDWEKITGQQKTSSYVIYAGKENVLTANHQGVFSWKSLPELLAQIYSQ